VVAKKAGEGAMIRAENAALKALSHICCCPSKIVIVADRGFGKERWLRAVAAQG
jgi:hypothetical protein